MSKETHVTDGTQQPPFKDKVKSAFFHMADGAPAIAPAAGIVAGAGAVIAAGAGAVIIAAAAGAAGGVSGVAIAGTGAVIAGVDSLRKYNNTLPAHIAKNWKNAGTGLSAAFSLAAGLTAGIATYNHLTEDMPQTMQTRQYSLTGPADVDCRLTKVFAGSGLDIVNDNNKPVTLYATPQGCQLTAKP